MNWSKATGVSHRSEYFESCKIVAVVEGWLPILSASAEIFFNEHRSLDLIERQVVNIFSRLGYQTEEEISSLLCIPMPFVQGAMTILEDELAKLRTANEDDRRLRFKEMFDSGGYSIQKSALVNVHADITTGTILSGLSNSTVKRFVACNEDDMKRISEVCDAFKGIPTSALECYAKNIGLISSHIKALDSNISKTTYVKRACEIVIFQIGDSEEWSWEIFDPIELKRSSEMNTVAQALGIEKVAIDFFNLSSSIESALNGESSIREHLHLEVEKNNRTDSIVRLNTLDAAKALLTDIDNARSEIILVLPWIKGGAVKGNLENALINAVKRGVRIYILYGISDSVSSEESHINIINKLNTFHANDYKAGCTVVWGGNTHCKECLFDRETYYTGSFNFLSYWPRPEDESGKVRQESMNRFPPGQGIESIESFLHCYKDCIINNLTNQLVSSSAEQMSYPQWHWGQLVALAGPSVLHDARTQVDLARLDLIGAIALVHGVSDAGALADTEVARLILQILEGAIISSDKAAISNYKTVLTRALDRLADESTGTFKSVARIKEFMI